MDKRRSKRIKYLRRLYPAIAQVVILPFAILVVWILDSVQMTGFLRDLLGEAKLSITLAMVDLSIVYLLAFPFFYVFVGLHLFEWDPVNMLRSIRSTFAIRYSLFHQPDPQDNNRVIKDFNRAIKKSSLCIMFDVMEFVIPMPLTVGAQEMLKAQEDAIRERIGLMCPEYALSSFEREGMKLVLVGTRH